MIHNTVKIYYQLYNLSRVEHWFVTFYALYKLFPKQHK